MGSRKSTPGYRAHRRNGDCFGHIAAHWTSIATICQEALQIAHPYHVELAAHFMVFCSTLVVLVGMLFISQGAISICEGLLNIDPLFMKIIIYASDIFISAHFIKYLLQTWTH